MAMSYVLLLHLFVVVAVFRAEIIDRVKIFASGTPAVSAEYRGIVAAQVLQAKASPEKPVFFLGDSITAGLNVSSISDRAINFGIGGDTTMGLAWRINQYPNLHHARAIVIEVGVNDLPRFNDDQIIEHFGQILESLPVATPRIVSCILPVREDLLASANTSIVTGLQASNDRIARINERLKKFSDANTFVIDPTSVMCDQSGNLAESYTVDGCHLSANGYEAWSKFLRERINSICNDRS